MTYIDNRTARLLSHRLRGFDRRDSTRLGLEHALIAGVRQVEFDIRFTRDGKPVAYHDPIFKADDGKWHYINEWELSALCAQGAFWQLATLEEMCACFKTFQSPGTLLHLDVKAEGYESVVHEIITRFGLLSNVVLVSWLPTVLHRFNALSPHTRLCFSHLPLVPSLYAAAKTLSPIANHAPAAFRQLLRIIGPQILKEASTLTLYFDDDGDPASWVEDNTGAHHNVCHVVPGPVRGAMLDLLRRVNGMICVPVWFATQTLAQVYRSQDIQIAVYSVNGDSLLRRVTAEINPDIVYVDNADFILRAIRVRQQGRRPFEAVR